MAKIIKCIETGMATILIESGKEKFKIDILKNELEHAIKLAREGDYSTLKEYLLSFDPQFAVGIEFEGIEAIATALINS